jgi:hypothetical protein
VKYHLGDLESDMSVFHRVDDLYELDGPRFMRLAWRIGAYNGMITRRVQAAQEDPAPSPLAGEPAPARLRSAPARAVREQPAVGDLPSGASMVPVSALNLMMPGLIERA